MLNVVLAGHNTFIAVAACYWEVFLQNQTSQRTKKVVSVTSRTGCAVKVFKNKARTFYSFAGIGASHESRMVCCVFACFIFLGWVYCFRKMLGLMLHKGASC